MREGQSLRMLFGLLVGAGLGVLAHALAPGASWLEGLIHYLTEPVGRIFLRLLFMLVLPLALSALALGVTAVGDLRQLGRIGLKTLAYTVVVSTVAVLIGVALVNLLQPGASVSPEVRQGLAARAGAVPAPPPSGATGVDFVVNLVPANLVKAMAEGDMLAVMVFALFLGIGLTLTPSPAARRFEEGLEGLFDVIMRLLQLVVAVAPVGVACLMFTMTAHLGWSVLDQIGRYVLVVILGLAIHQFGVYSLSVAWLGGMSPRRFFAAVRPAMVTAFSTASSNATLPTALLVAEERLRLPPQVSRFVLTIGSTANQNGTALFEGVTVLFLAQLYGVPLTVAQQVTVAFVCVLGGIGTAGVPAGSLPVVAMILGMIGVPAEGLALILGVDRLLDMCRTTLNVTGDLAAAVVVARGERATAPVAAEGAARA